MNSVIQLPGRDLLIRELSDTDSVDELTQLLHRAYRPLLDMGFRYVATRQGADVTRERIQNRTCLVGLFQEKIAATICYHSPQQTRGCPWYDRSDVASFGQFAVVPELQRLGIGSRFVEFSEQLALGDGAKELALDTAEGASHLIRFYEKRGYRFIEHAQWDVTNYRSAIMSKRLRA